MIQSEEVNNLPTSLEIENMNLSSGLRENLTSTALPDVVAHQDIENAASNQVIIYCSNSAYSFISNRSYISSVQCQK